MIGDLVNSPAKVLILAAWLGVAAWSAHLAGKRGRSKGGGFLRGLLLGCSASRSWPCSRTGTGSDDRRVEAAEHLALHLASADGVTVGGRHPVPVSAGSRHL
jgi:hypothetical protein